METNCCSSILFCCSFGKWPTATEANSTTDLKDTALAKMLNDCVCLPLPVLSLCHALFSWPGLFALKYFALNVIYLMLLLNL